MLNNNSIPNSYRINMPSQNNNVELQNLQNDQNLNNIQNTQVQNAIQPNYNYPPLMQNPQMINLNPQAPEKSPHRFNHLDVESQVYNNSQQRYPDFTPNNQYGQEQQTLNILPTTENLDRIQTQTMFNQNIPGGYNQQSYYPEQKLQSNNNENQVQIDIVQNIPPNPMAESSMTKSKLARIHTLRKSKELTKKKTFIKQNTMSHSIVKAADHHIYYFVDTPDYHQNQCCLDLYYKDDCCLKWICDSIFYLIFIPFGLLALIFKGVGSICCSDFCENCFECFQKCFYSPFGCFGDWINQCWFSCNNFCCEGIDFIPDFFKRIYTNCFQKCFLQIGQFLKNCCSFPVECNCCDKLASCCDKKCECPDCPDCTSICKNSNGDYCCNDCCQCLGDCCQNCCTPQGFCEDCYKCCNKCSCNAISTDCCECMCCCCVQTVKIIGSGGNNHHNNYGGGHHHHCHGSSNSDEAVGELIVCCFCCICKTLGAVLEGLGNLAD